ncbi:MAG: RNA-binding protein, partial [Methanobacteriota archaeon]
MNEDIISGIKRDYILSLAKSGKRVEKRGFDEFRPISLEVGVIEKAEGSARVKLGDTDVVVGIKAEIGEPFPDRPEEGVITTNAELVPLASPTFEAGPPNEDAIELARVVDRGIRESEALNLKKLCLIPGEKVWVIFIDMHILDYSGNLFDACTLGAISALWNTKLPEAKVVETPNGEKKVELDPQNPVP